MVAGAVYLGMDETNDKSAAGHLADIRYFALAGAGAIGGAALLRKKHRQQAREKGKSPDMSSSDGGSTSPQQEKGGVQTHFSYQGAAGEISPTHSRYPSTMSATTQPGSYWANEGELEEAGDRRSYLAGQRNSLLRKAARNSAQRSSMIS